MAASVSPSATSRARRSYLALPDLRGDGVDQLLGAIARGGEEHRRVAALPLPITTPTTVSRRPATVTRVKKARHLSAAESDPILPA